MLYLINEATAATITITSNTGTIAKRVADVPVMFDSEIAVFTVGITAKTPIMMTTIIPIIACVSDTISIHPIKTLNIAVFKIINVKNHNKKLKYCNQKLNNLYKMARIIKTVSLKPIQVDFINSQNISISRLLQGALNKRMKKSRWHRNTLL